MTEALYRLPPITMSALGNGDVVVRHEATGATELVSEEDAELLSLCQQFRSLSGHAEYIAAATAHEGPEKKQRLLSRLTDNVRLRRLRSQHDFLARAEPGWQYDPPSDELSWLVIPTRDRLGALCRCIVGHQANASSNGRPLEVLVADSTASDHAEVTRQAITRLRAAAESNIVYLGHQEIVAYAEQLSLAGDIPPDIVRFAVLGHPWPGEAIGANRNVILLRTVGARILSVDDDTVCSPCLAPAAEVGEALSLRGDTDAPEIWSFADRESVLSAARPASLDVVGSHASYLGWPIAGLIQKQQLHGMHIDIQAACPHLLKSLLVGTGRVIATMNGIAGDSGMYSGELLALHESHDTRHRLLGSLEHYRVAMSSRELIRQSLTTVVSHGGQFMSTCVGLDNRVLLPPFLPVYRSEDRVFGAMVMACYDDAYYAHLPWCLIHAPGQKRGYVTDPWSNVRVSDVIIALIEVWSTAIRPAAGAARLCALGAEFEDIASLEAGDFKAIVMYALKLRLFGAIRHKEQLLRRYNGEPSYWANEVRRQMSLSAESLQHDEYAVPIELRGDTGDPDGLSRLRALLKNYGGLLRWWQALTEVASSLNRYSEVTGSGIVR